MDEKTQELFYIGAAVYLDLDSDQVDTILKQAGLSTKDNSVVECRDVIKAAYPERYRVMGTFGSNLGYTFCAQPK